VLFAHRIRLEPNNVQATGLSKAAGVARFAYNWALGEWQRQYELSKTNAALPKPGEAALRRQLNAIKRSTFPWMLEVTKNAPQMAIIQLGQAFDNFFNKLPAIQGSAEKAVTIVSRLPTISSRLKINASASQSWAGCACANACGMRGMSSLRQLHAMPAAGTPALLSTPLMIHHCRRPKTKARWAWIWVLRHWRLCQTVRKSWVRKR
jgi:hypothetical protein